MKHDLLTRLRNANPVPAPPAPSAESDELFRSIVAQPGDPRLAVRRRPRVLGRRGLVLVVAVCVAAVTASTAVALSGWLGGSGPVKPPVTRHEYEVAQHQLTLPPGYSWPKLYIDPNSVTSVGAGGGHAVLIAQNDWECYWVDAIHRGDQAGQQRAHDELNSLLAHNVFEAPSGASENYTPPNPPTTPYVVFAHDGGLDWVKQSYALAAAGHPKRLEESCKANR